MTDIRVDNLCLDRESVAVWPALREERLGEWVLRFGGGLYGRSNSVQPYGDPGGSVEAAIDRVERLYREEGLAPTFRLPELPEFATLEERLAARGYAVEDPTTVMTADISSPPASPIAVQAVNFPSDDWLRAYVRLNHRAPGREGVVGRIWTRLPAPRRFATFVDGGEVISIGAATVRESRIWIFGMATDPAHRGRGLASGVMTDLIRWADREGARDGALQVVASNGPAQALYVKFGFDAAYGYHYRRLR